MIRKQAFLEKLEPFVKLYIYTEKYKFMEDNTKFFFYELKALDSDKNELNIEDILKNKNFVVAAKTIQKEEEKMLYSIYFKEMGDNFYFGKIIRSKSPENFQTTKDNFFFKALKSFLGKEQRIVETDKDITYFLINLQKKKLTVMIQTGYGKAGMGKLRMLLNEIIGKDVDDFSCKSLTKAKENIFKFLKNKKVKSVRWKFRKNPEVPKDTNLEKVIKSVQSTIDDIFYIDMIIDVGRLGKNKINKIPVFGQFYEKFLGKKINPDEIDINLPEFLDNFDVEYIKADGNLETKTEHILDLFEKTQINIEKLKSGNDEEISKALLKSFKEKFPSLIG